jgi:ABC-type polysaccharide/polyol phosphate export permease
MIAGFRAGVLGGRFPLDLILISGMSGLVLCAAGVRYFLQMERRFADVI